MHDPRARRRQRWLFLLALSTGSGGCWPAFDALQGGGGLDGSVAGDGSPDSSRGDATTSDALAARDAATAGGDASDGSVSAEASSSPSAYAAAVLADGPFGYWRLDEVPGATGALDSSGNGNGGGFHGGVTLGVAGALHDGANRAANFDGTTASLALGLLSEIGGRGESFSYELWFRPTQLTPGARILSREYFDSDNPANDLGTALAIDGTDAGGVSGFSFRQYNGRTVARSVASAQLPSTTSFTYVVVTYDAVANSICLYVDGSQIASNEPTPDPAYMPALTNFSWAATSDPAGSFFAGDLDELAVYGKALSVAQVQAHYLAATSP